MGDNQDSTSELIKKNCSEVGAAIIQRLYREDYLSPGGKHATERLTRLAAPTKDTRILDVGRGVAGAAGLARSRSRLLRYRSGPGVVEHRDSQSDGSLARR